MLNFKSRLILAVAILPFGHIAGASTEDQATDQTVHVVLFAGQSNMAGDGDYQALDDADKTQVARAAKTVQLSYNGKPAGPLSYFTAKPEHSKYGFTDKFGPELFVGVELAKANPRQEYLFIKRAQGGTALYGAWNPEWSAEKSKAVEKGAYKQGLQLVKDHTAFIHQELARLEAAGKRYQIVGMFWMQGENDAAKEVSARSYEANLKKLIAHYRGEFNVPDMPFVFGQINSRYGDFDEGPAMVRQAMIDVAAADPNAAVISTTANPPWSDFPKHPDQVHYNEVGQKRLGTAFGQALLKLQK